VWARIHKRVRETHGIGPGRACVVGCGGGWEGRRRVRYGRTAREIKGERAGDSSLSLTYTSLSLLFRPPRRIPPPFLGMGWGE
jgi:hypothetical protein